MGLPFDRHHTCCTRREMKLFSSDSRKLLGLGVMNVSTAFPHRSPGNKARMRREERESFLYWLSDGCLIDMISLDKRNNLGLSCSLVGWIDTFGGSKNKLGLLDNLL